MKKGQAAMEFLMTYGWAILVVLAAIGALAYFGVLSPKLPNQCVMVSGFTCSEFKITNTTVQINMGNSIGYDLSGVNISLAGQSPNACTPYQDVSTLNNGASTGVLSYACTITGKFKGTISINYTKAGEATWHIGTGSISGSVEQ